MEMLQSIMLFAAGNMSIILVVVAVIYFVVLFFMIKNGTGGRISIRNTIGFGLVLCVAIYCLVTGNSLSDFLG